MRFSQFPSFPTLISRHRGEVMTSQEILWQLLHEIREMKKMLDERNGAEKELLTIDECAELTGLKKSTLYRMTHKRMIPYSKPGGNRVYIKQADIIKWLKSNRISSSEEMERTSAKYLINNILHKKKTRK